MEQQLTQEELNDLPVSFTITIGEVQAIFGVIARSAFVSVMQRVISKVNRQIRSHDIPLQTPQEASTIEVNLVLTVAELNNIFSIINGGPFEAMMKPTLGKIQRYAQAAVEAVNQTQGQTQPAPQIDMNFLKNNPVSPPPSPQL